MGHFGNGFFYVKTNEFCSFVPPSMSRSYIPLRWWVYKAIMDHIAMKISYWLSKVIHIEQNDLVLYNLSHTMNFYRNVIGRTCYVGGILIR